MELIRDGNEEARSFNFRKTDKAKKELIFTSLKGGWKMIRFNLKATGCFNRPDFLSKGGTKHEQDTILIHCVCFYFQLNSLGQ
jgi:hypothetical protein